MNVLLNPDQVVEELKVSKMNVDQNCTKPLYVIKLVAVPLFFNVEHGKRYQKIAFFPYFKMV